MNTLHKGGVYDLGDGAYDRVVVVSSDAMLVTGLVWIAPLLRQMDGDPAPNVLVIQTNQTDPVTGFVTLTMTWPAGQKSLGAFVGTLGGATMAKVDDGLRAMFDL